MFDDKLFFSELISNVLQNLIERIEEYTNRGKREPIEYQCVVFYCIMRHLNQIIIVL